MRLTWDTKTIVAIPVVALAVYLVLVPLVFLIWSSFRSAPFGFPAFLTFQNYTSVYGNPATYAIIFNTLIFGVSSAAIAVVSGVSLAWCLERANMPFKKTLYTMVVVPLAIPGILYSIAWVLLLSPRIGVINTYLRDLFSVGPINVYSLPGMIFLEGLYLTPAAFLIMAASFKRMDPALEEASHVAGATTIVTLRRITLRVMRPAILGAFIYILVTAMESFDVPAVIGMQAGIHVLSTSLYLAKLEAPPNYGALSTLAILLLCLSILLVFLYGRITTETQRFVTVTGKGYRPKAIDLGYWKYAVLGFVLVYFALTVICPVTVLFWASLLPFYQAPSLEALSAMSLDTYRGLVSYPSVWLAFKNTLLMVLTAPTVTMVLCTVISWFIVKSRAKGRRLLDVITFLPHAIPGIVVGVAVMWTYVALPVPIYGTLWILLIVYVTTRMAYGTRVMNGAMLQLHSELEEASYTSGGSWLGTFRRVTLPLLRPAFVNGWLFTAILVSKVLGAVVLVYTNSTIVLPVLVWEMWNSGEISEAAALGVIGIVVTVALAFIARTYEDNKL